MSSRTSITRSFPGPVDRPRPRWLTYAQMLSLAPILMIGALAAYPTIADLPVNPAMMAVVPLAWAALFASSRSGFRLRPLLPFLAFAVSMLPAFIAGLESSYGFEKGVTFFLLVLPVTIAFAQLFRARDDIGPYLMLWALMGCVGAGFALVFPITQPYGEEYARVALGATTGSLLGYYVGVGALAYVLGAFEGLLPKVLIPPVLAASGWLVVASGGRGPVLACTAGVVVFVLLSRGAKFKLQAIALVAMLVAFFYALGDRLPGYAASRATSFEDETRLELWRGAWSLFVNHPFFGVGLGGFDDGFFHYPHNVVLETASEAGLFSLILLGTTLIVAVVRAVRARSIAGVPSVAAIATFLLTWAMVSGDITNRLPWLGLAGLLLLDGKGFAHSQGGDRAACVGDEPTSVSPSGGI